MLTASFNMQPISISSALACFLCDQCEHRKRAEWRMIGGAIVSLYSRGELAGRSLDSLFTSAVGGHVCVVM